MIGPGFPQTVSSRPGTPFLETSPRAFIRYASRLGTVCLAVTEAVWEAKTQ